MTNYSRYDSIIGCLSGLCLGCQVYYSNNPCLASRKEDDYIQISVQKAKIILQEEVVHKGINESRVQEHLLKQSEKEYLTKIVNGYF